MQETDVPRKHIHLPLPLPRPLHLPVLYSDTDRYRADLQILLSGHSVSVLPGSENVLSESPSFQSTSESDCLPGAEDCITNAPALLPDYQIRKQSSPDPALPEVISV